jgi:hypothetical protein
VVTPPAPQSRAGLICCTAAQATVDSVAVPPPTSTVAPATRPRIWTPPCSPATCPRHINWWARWRPGWPREGVRPRVASMAGPVGLAGGAAYGASKAALTAMTHGWAAEFSSSSVRINSVAPAPVYTDGANDDLIGQLGATTLRHRAAQPAKIRPGHRAARLSPRQLCHRGDGRWRPHSGLTPTRPPCWSGTMTPKEGPGASGAHHHYLTLSTTTPALWPVLRGRARCPT